MAKLKLQASLLLKPGFHEAFDKLCADPLSVAERYRLGKTRRILQDEGDAFNKELVGLRKKHGEPELGLLERRVVDLNAMTSPEKNMALKRVENRIVQLRQSKVETFMVDDQNAEKMAAFNADLEELKAIEFATDLEGKVKLLPDSKLTGVDIDILLDLVELDEQPAEPKD